MAETVQESEAESRKRIFEELPVPQALKVMVVPTIISQIIVLIYNMADTFYVGRTNDPYMVAGVSLILPVFNILICLAGLAGTGGGTLISRLLGEGKETEGILRYLSRRRGDPRLRPVKDFEKLFEGEIFYVSCIDEKSRLDDLNEAVEKSLDLRSIYEQEVYQTDYWCEIMPQTTSKGAAARFLADYLGMERIVAFGDAPNDISLFAAADEGYAVKNADESLKAVATGVIGYSEEDAVVKHIRAHIDEYIR